MTHLSHLDHRVLTVRDLDASCRFYADVLGMAVITFAGGRKALRFGQQKSNLYVQGREFAPRAHTPPPGAAGLCLITHQPLAGVVAHLAACQVAVMEGPVPSTGATGPILSVYCRDPDANLIEIANVQPAGESRPRHFFISLLFSFLQGFSGRPFKQDGANQWQCPSVISMPW